MGYPIFISHWVEHDNSIFEIGESVTVSSTHDAQAYIDKWRQYTKDEVNFIDGFIVKSLLVASFYINDIGKMAMETRFIDLEVCDETRN